MLRRVGKVIIVLTLALSWNFYLLIFTIPAFLIGVILLWTNRSSIKSNVYWTIIPIILWYPLGYLFLYLTSTVGFATAQKFDFVVPIGFRGDIIIVGNMPCGQKKVVKNGREQLFIPSNGILLYQGDIKYGYVNHQYYFDSGNSHFSQIPERFNYMYFESEKKPPPKQIVGAWLGGTGNKTFDDDKIYYEFMNLTIASKDSIDKVSDFQKEKKFEHLTDSLVKQCLK